MSTQFEKAERRTDLDHMFNKGGDPRNVQVQLPVTINFWKTCGCSQKKSSVHCMLPISLGVVRRSLELRFSFGLVENECATLVEELHRGCSVFTCGWRSCCGERAPPRSGGVASSLVSGSVFSSLQEKGDTGCVLPPPFPCQEVRLCLSARSSRAGGGVAVVYELHVEVEELHPCVYRT